MEEEEVVAVGFPSPVDELKVPDNWCRGMGNSMDSLGDPCCVKKIDCHYMQYLLLKQRDSRSLVDV